MTSIPKILVGGSGSPLKLDAKLREIQKAKDSVDIYADLMKSSDSNKDGVIIDEEADKTLRNLDRYLRGNIEQLSEKEVEKRIEYIEVANKALTQPALKPLFGLDKYGEVFNLAIEGKIYQILLVQNDKLEAAKIDLKTLFADQKRKDFELKGQFITDVDTEQTKAVWAAIVKDNPALKDKLGVFSMAENLGEGGPIREIHKMLVDSGIVENFGVTGTKVFSRRITEEWLFLTISKPFKRGAEVIPLDAIKKTEPMPGESGTSSRSAIMFGILIE